MFVAISINDRTRVTSISSHWSERLDRLRELASSGELVCPGCKQLLWLRTGEKRRRHFAHRQNSDCPLARESLEVLEAKAQLFEWLEKKYPKQVQLDMPVEGTSWEKTVDLMVEPKPGLKFAYWVFDRQQRDRENFTWYRDRSGQSVHFVHTQSALKIHSKREIALSASQRDFIGHSDFDTCVERTLSGHLLFLQGTEPKISIYRGLWCVHQPNLYGWEVLREGALEKAKIHPKTGEIVLPEDVEARRLWREKRAQIEKNVRLAHRAEAVQIAPPALPDSRPTIPAQKLPVESPPAKIQEPDSPPLNINGPFRCEDCGVETMEWSESTPSTGTCVCRSCAKTRYLQRKSQPMDWK